MSKLPTYYTGELFVRMNPFKDHINIEAKAILNHVNEFPCFKITILKFIYYHLR